MPSYPTGGYSPGAWSVPNASTPNSAPATIAANSSWESGLMVCQGYNALAATAMLTESGSISIQRYADQAGLLPIGSAISQALTANTLGTVAVNDGLPFASFEVTVANSSGSTGTLSDFSILISNTGSA